jgi:type II secretory pathway component PulC
MAACDAARFSQSQSAAAAPAPAPLARTAPDLDLVGVVQTGGAGTAIIAERAGPQRAYGVGDAVRPGLVLEKIAGDGVVLVAGETRYRLPVRRSVAAAGTAPESRAVDEKHDQGLSSFQQRNSSPDAPEQGRLTPYPGGGMRLDGVRPGSPYANMGLRAGDVLLGVNGATLESPDQLMRLVRGQRFGPQQVEVLRDGRLETLRFGPG